MDYDKDKVDDMVLALLWLTTFGEKQLGRWVSALQHDRIFIFERNPRQECCMLSCSYRAAAFARKRLL